MTDGNFNRDEYIHNLVAEWWYCFENKSLDECEHIELMIACWDSHIEQQLYFMRLNSILKTGAIMRNDNNPYSLVS